MRLLFAFGVLLGSFAPASGQSPDPRAAVAVAVAASAAKAPPPNAACDCPSGGKCDCGPACDCPAPAKAAATADNRDDALAEVNAWRARNGYKPFVRDEGLTRAARACAAHRAGRLLFGHTDNDFSFLPPGCHADAAGCAAYPASYGWLSCCMRDSETYGGAAWAVGSDGKRYMHLYVSNRPNGLPPSNGGTKSTPAERKAAPAAPESPPADPELAGVQVPIARPHRVFNRTGVQCAWCTAQSLAVHNGHPAAADLTRTHPGEIRHVDQLRSELDRLGVRSWYTPARDADALERYCRAGFGCGVGVRGGEHMLLVCHCDRAGNTVKVIDNSDPGLRVQTLTWPQFAATWSDTVFVVPPKGVQWADPPRAAVAPPVQSYPPQFAPLQFAQPGACPGGR